MQIDFQDWLERLLREGESVQTEPPPGEIPHSALPLLASAYERHALDVAGPTLEWDAAAGARAVLQLARACWSVASGENDSAVGAHGEPTGAAAHLSADLTLRFLPLVYRRAKAKTAESKLTASLKKILCAWPLSGVLADLAEPPTNPPTFAGHAGLQMLYAERLALQPRAAWVPPEGAGREWVERVFQERGKPLPAHLAEESPRE